MPYSSRRPPRAARRYRKPVASKAAKITNALLRKGMSEGRAIRIGAAAAKKWARRRHIRIRKRP